MPPKKATGTATTKKTAAAPDHPSYKDMIKEAILQLKERNGSSRQAIKKYVQSNFKGIKATNFDTQFNAALKRGVTSGEFVQPKGPSGTVKLQKKEASVKPAIKPAKSATDKPKKIGTTKKSTTKKVAPATKAPKAKTVAAPKAKATTANSKKSRKTATAPAVTDKPSVLTKTKSGRVSKGTTGATKVAPKKKTATTAATKKKATPKKKAEAAPVATAAD